MVKAEILVTGVLIVLIMHLMWFGHKGHKEQTKIMINEVIGSEAFEIQIKDTIKDMYE